LSCFHRKKFTFLLLFLFYDVARRNRIQVSPIEEGCKLICSISKRIKFLENLCNLAAKEGEKSIKKEGEKKVKELGELLPIIKEDEHIKINMINNIIIN